MYKTVMTLHGKGGQRKYLNQEERLIFLEISKKKPIDVKIFSQLLFYTGARIAEIHNLHIFSIDFSNKTVILETLKRRKKGVFREIPLPLSLLNILETYIEGLLKRFPNNQSLFLFSLRTASRHIKHIMIEAKISGAKSSSRGLRHGFAVHAVSHAPLTMVRKWLGHSSLETTAIYLDVVGKEEREIAEKLWLK
ncbi:tyrosine-type recombinase/integrase [Winogradskyella sp. SYSU M77433]|uniref:tyrosine-type recombinase/integrase n=1 Tax=Winogradskyella sp. SYSU M77433 TaxID=3042722 RepID=UPI0024801520|nr:tyrosine-type recombinase/integrase [Winogradskyella sp. SYSU M77433]MDH7911335.1 tyrosine-type recombinase/integrase [Winogradskyella sp. SYSU M77433]